MRVIVIYFVSKSVELLQMATEGFYFRILKPFKSNVFWVPSQTPDRQTLDTISPRLTNTGHSKP